MISSVFGAALKQRRLFFDFLAEFHAHRPFKRVAVFIYFAGNERFDSGEVIRRQIGNVASAGIAAIAINGIYLDPQAVIPVRATRLRQPGAASDKNQQYQQNANSYRFKHVSLAHRNNPE